MPKEPKILSPPLPKTAKNSVQAPQKHTAPKSPSKLSLGPKNPHHKTFQQNHRAIFRSLDQALARRELNLRPTDICRRASISAPTFYYHCHSSNHALRLYESELRSAFIQGLLRTTRRKQLFVYLFSFIAKHRSYFRSTLKARDAFLLSEFIKSLRHQLAPESISDKSFFVYSHNIQTIIFLWGEFDHFSADTMPHYVEQASRLRIPYIPG